MDTREALTNGSAYESFMGRWSRVAAREFLEWLSVPSYRRWLDVGCGTGALSSTILELASPRAVLGVDPSADYVTYAQLTMQRERSRFVAGDALALPAKTGRFDVVVSGLVLNQISDPAAALAEMIRVSKSGSVVAAYVWDFAGGMQMFRCFWDAAIELDPAAEDLDQRRRFPICHPDRLRELFQGSGLGAIEVRPIDAPAVFRGFDDYWSPFLSGHGLRAPGYVLALDADHRSALEARIRNALPVRADGSIELMARAWAVRGSNHRSIQ